MAILEPKISFGILIITAITFLPCGSVASPKANTSTYPRIVKRIETLLLNAPENSRYGQGKEEFSSLGCSSDVIAKDVNPKDVVSKLLNNNRATLTRLKREKSSTSYRLLGLLQEHNIIKSNTDYRTLAIKSGDWFYLEQANPLYSNVKPIRAIFVRVSRALRVAADKGSANACYKLSGRTHESDLKKLNLLGDASVGADKPSEYWLNRAATLGSIDAMATLSNQFYDTQSKHKKLLEKAAKGGENIANYDIGNAYLNGSDGFPQDFTESKKYHCRAVFFGNQWSGSALKIFKKFDERRSEVSKPRSSTAITVASLPAGKGRFDSMTYAEYSSEVEIQPLNELTITEVQPAVNYCNGFCFVEVKILNESNETLSSSYWQGMTLPTSFGELQSPLPLKAGQKYRVLIDVSTSMSIGINTAGLPPYSDSAISFHALKFSQEDRGPISFDLLKSNGS